MAQAAVEHPNITLFRRGLEAFNSGDIDTVRSLLADDVVWHTPGRARYAGDTRGIEETLGFFLRLAQDTNGTLRLDVHDILANDTHAVALVNVHWEHTARRSRTRQCRSCTCATARQPSPGSSTGPRTSSTSSSPPDVSEAFGQRRSPKIALPTRTIVAPSAMATSKSSLMPMLNSGSGRLSR